MLVLTRRAQQSIMIGDEVEVHVLSLTRENVRLGIEAPRAIPVFRKEVYLEIERESAATSARAEVDDALKRLTQR